MLHKTFGAIVAAAALAIAPVAHAQLTEDIQFSVVNNTDETITGVRLSSSRDPNWGEEINTDETGPGETMQVSITDDLPDCDYDLRLEFKSGRVLEYGQVNLCSINGQTVTVR
jgi:hypothetical protein